MINRNAIIEWGRTVPWVEPYYIEQDLIISRALVAIYSDEILSSKLAFRGGTAINKLFFETPSRYSEDLDFVQIQAEPIGETLDRIKEALSFLGNPKTKRKMSNNVLLYAFDAEGNSGMRLHLKIEINCKEHFSVYDKVKMPFSVKNQWYTGQCNVTTYCFDELIGTKIRALYQRRKGRDLYDIYMALESGLLSVPRTIECYREYIAFPDNHIPTANEYSDNLATKMHDQGFLEDIVPILPRNKVYDVDRAYNAIIENIVCFM